MMSVHAAEPIHDSSRVWRNNISDSDSFSDDGNDGLVESQLSRNHGPTIDTSIVGHGDDADDDDDLDGMDDDMGMISSSPSIDDDNIDFNYVYALHTFQATVEGQANALKGDVMILLDDSNSYWWLVRLIKDNTIGYLPAEHIETPTERLARRNKHRNVDLASPMVSDRDEKPENPILKAMRRRNAKTVAFAPPTYVEPSDYEYSSDEDIDCLQTPIEPGMQQSSAASDRHYEAGSGDEVSIITDSKDTSLEHAQIQDSSSDSLERKNSLDMLGADDDSADATTLGESGDSGPVMRNTDSFFKDDETQTKKISLTPVLLQDDEPPCTDEPESDRKLDRKEEKKEKKTGILSHLFKRRTGKPGKSTSDENPIKSPIESVSPGELASTDSLDTQVKADDEAQNLESVSRKPSSDENLAQIVDKVQLEEATPSEASSKLDPSTKSTIKSVLKKRENNQVETSTVTRSALSDVSPNRTVPTEIPVSTTIDLSDEEGEDEDGTGKVPQLVKDDTSSQDDESPVPSPIGNEKSGAPGGYADEKTPSLSSQGESIPSRFSSSSQLGHSDDAMSSRRGAQSSMSFSSSRLLQFIQQPSNIRDVLLVVRDIEKVDPVPSSHPLMADLFTTETKDLDRLDRELDGLLGDWYGRRGPVSAVATDTKV